MHSWVTGGTKSKTAAVSFKNEKQWSYCKNKKNWHMPHLKEWLYSVTFFNIIHWFCGKDFLDFLGLVLNFSGVRLVPIITCFADFLNLFVCVWFVSGLKSSKGTANTNDPAVPEKPSKKTTDANPLGEDKVSECGHLKEHSGATESNLQSSPASEKPGLKLYHVS